MLLAIICRHPNRNIDTFQSKLCDLLMENMESKKILYSICGDININTLRADDNKTMEYINSLNQPSN